MVATAWLLLAAAATAQTSISLQKSFSPSSIGPGSISTMTLTVVNSSGSGSRSLSVTDSLPSGMTVADPAIGTNGCGGTVTATSGGSSVSFDGSVGAGGSCSVQVNVTASSPGSYANTANLTSDIGSASGSATLTVDAGVPGFSKSFSPNPTTLGGRSRLTFTIDNSANSAARARLTFVDSLPVGMTVASPPNASSTCVGGTLTAAAGSSSVSYAPSNISFNDASVGANSTCTLAVDVVANSSSMPNLSGELTSIPFNVLTTASSGKAGATLTSFAERLTLAKSFVDDPVAAGGTVNLQFTIRSLERSNTITDIAFTDDLDAALSGLTAVSLPSNPCGSGSSISGSSTLSLTGGTLAAGDICTFTVGLQVPAGASAGSYVNTTGSVTGTSGGTGVVGSPASDTLFLEAGTGLEISKTFLDNPVGSGGSTELEFTLTNTGESTITDIAFTDVFFNEAPTASGIPSSGFCGGSSTATYFPLTNPPAPSDAVPARLIIAGASLEGGTSCTFSITLGIGQNAASGPYSNTTGEVTGSIDGEEFSIEGASDVLQIYAGPELTKEFIDDPTIPGGTATLRFTLSLEGNENNGNATGITFTDDLDAALSGLVATGLPTSPCGGTMVGSSTLTLSGASLSAGDSCFFDVEVTVPVGSLPGSYTNTTSSVLASVEGVDTVSPAASDDLQVAGISFSKEFIDDPTVAGGSVTLRFTIDNVGSFDATGMSFNDNLTNTLNGLVIASLPGTDPCGSGSSVTGISANRIIVLSSGNLLAGTSCSFDVVLTVPAGAVDGSYPNSTSNLIATVAGNTVSLPAARDELEVLSEVMLLTKEFVDDPVTPGDNVTLQFTVANLTEQTITNVAFSDDLSQALPGLVSVSGSQSACNGGTFSGISDLVLVGGSLGGGATCTITVSLSVPLSADGSSPIVNTTSIVTGTLNGLSVEGPAATDELLINSLSFSKFFGVESAEPGDTVSLTFQIVNSGSETVSEIAFTDNLDSFLSGTVIASPLPSSPCGAGSTLSGAGSGFLTFLGGTLLPGGSCSFSVDIVVPAFASPDVYTNVTSDLRVGGLPVAEAATASIEITEPPVIVDSDGDGVLDGDDLCADTVIPEGVPTVKLLPNHYALVDEDTVFDTKSPPGNGNGPGDVFTTTDTGGCSCEQIIVALGLGEGHVKHGCSIGVMRVWASIASGEMASYNAFGDGSWGTWMVNPGN